MIGQRDGGDGMYTTKAQKADRMAIIEVIYRRWVHFLTSLNSGGTYAQWEVGSFFNELEPCRNYAQG